MKKFLFIPIACIISLFSCSCSTTTKIGPKNIDCYLNAVSQSTKIDCAAPTDTDSVIALLLYNYIDDAIQNYYGAPTQFALYDAKVTDITQIENSFSYNVTITVPHLSRCTQSTLWT